MRIPLLRSWIPWLAILLAGAGSRECSDPPASGLPPSLAGGSSQLVPAVPERRPESLHALLINGGGWHEINYRSHVHHLERLLELLDLAGVDRSRVSVLASDGADPQADLAVLNFEEEPDLWLLPSGLAGSFALLEYVSTEIEGVKLEPATPEAMEKWFEEVGSKLHEGDTLLLYVTDHGERNEGDLADNTISLWNGQRLGVRQLQRHLDRIDPSVRVVMLMSQCFGGAFANAIFAPEEFSPRGNVCGYFATTAERPAYGCYPQNAGRESVGHSHEVFDGLGLLGELQRAHRLSLITDRTPDVPNTSRDFYLRRVLARAAEAAEVPFDDFVDGWLRQAWKDRGAWEPEIRLLDQVAHTFGLFSPRSLREFAAEAEALGALSDQIDTYADRWGDALESARQQGWLRFAEVHPDWRERLSREAITKLDVGARRELLRELLDQFARFVREDGDTLARLERLKQKAEEARAAYYRTEVRIGATLRMRTLLTSIAGRTFVRETGGRPLENDERLGRCEALSLVAPAGPEQLAAVEIPEPFPQVADERKRIESVMPSWMGIRYQPVAARDDGESSDLPDGAVRIMTVFPDSPAASAAIKVGDIVLGQPGKPFSEPHSIREWTMQSELGSPTALELRRKDETLEVELVPGAFPLELPGLPGPPKVGAAAPTLELESVYRGARPGADRPTLLFFWATWCGPCKQSVPELMAFAEQRGVHVVAITDEEPEQLDPFFAKRAEPFPDTVVSDPYRAAFQAYGVSGTPTFVLIDTARVIQTYQRGYDSRKGLEIEGWSH